jgi:cobalt-zinc-cadmium efflux system membrane fusion protein
MGIPRLSRLSWTAVGVGAVLAVGIGAIVINGALSSRGSATEPSAALQVNKGLELVGPYTVAVPDEVRVGLGITRGKIERIVEVKRPKQAQAMTLPGSTMLDTGRLWRIRIRFPARVVEIAPRLDEEGKPVVDDVASKTQGKTIMRELRTGDTVKKGQRLGTFESADVGNIKSNLVDAISLFKLDQEILERGEAAFLKGAIPEVMLLNFRRNVEADQNAINRAAANLRAWDIPEADIQACYKEAEEIRKRGGKRDRDLEKLWSRVEIVAPEDGIIVERNLAQHEMIVDNTTNLFQIAKLDRLIILANCPEDDLPTLQDLDPKDRKWTVRTVGAARDKGIEGPIDEIGVLIDPNQHTAIIKGHIDNPGGRIRAGQFVAATIQLPPPPGCVEVPIDAIGEDGDMCVVFVQPDASKHEYVMRRVDVTHRFDKTAFVRSEPVAEKAKEKSAEEKDPPAESAMPILPLKPGERVLTTAVGELKAAILDLMSRPKKDSKEEKGK